MMRYFLFTSFAFALICLSSCRDTPLDQLSVSELDEHIKEVELILDSLQIIKAQKIAADTTGSYAAVTSDLSHLLTADSSVLIKGRILDSLESTTISIKQDRPYQSDLNTRMKIESDGSFRADLDIETDGFYELVYAGRSHQVYLSQGQEMTIVYDTTDRSSLLFGGDLAEENALLQQLDQSLSSHTESDAVDEDRAVRMGALDQPAPLDSIDELLAAAVGSRRQLLNPAFMHLLEQKTAYMKARLALKEYGVDHQAWDSLGVDLNAPQLFSLYDYRKFVFEYFEARADLHLDQSQSQDLAYFTRKFAYVDSLFTADKIVAFMKTDVLYEAIARVPSSRVNALVQQYESEVDDTAFRQAINKRYNQIISPLAGTLAPEITGTTYDGDPFQLSDHRGKYVYIFSWATWCGPCKVELPFYERMLEDYADENISFIGISVDKDRKKWTESFFYNDYPGLQVLVPGDWKSPFVRDYDVQSIPQFILIDPEGVIIDPHAQRPTKAIKAQLSQHGIFPKQT